MKLNKLILTLGSLCVALALANLACGQNAATKKKLKLAFVVNNASSFWTIAHAGVDDAVKELGNVAVDFRIPSDGQAATQRGMLDDLLAKGVDGIAVSPIDPGNQTEFLDKIASQPAVNAANGYAIR